MASEIQTQAFEPITKEEALAFLEAWRLMFKGKVGYRHLTEDLTRVIDYVQKSEPLQTT
ncbi:MAG: hypothetical protein FWF45_05700 [Coriobacteriia bacterium]|nr:hypothetical protein [Coriobacteriia bacterium]